MEKKQQKGPSYSKKLFYDFSWGVARRDTILLMMESDSRLLPTTGVEDVDTDSFHLGISDIVYSYLGSSHRFTLLLKMIHSIP